MGGGKWPKRQEDAKSQRDLDLIQPARWDSEVDVKKLCGQINYLGSHIEVDLWGIRLTESRPVKRQLYNCPDRRQGPEIMK